MASQETVGGRQPTWGSNLNMEKPLNASSRVAVHQLDGKAEHLEERGLAYGDINSQIEEFFRAKGIRWTPQRQMVVDSFRKHQGHISAEEVHNEIKKVFPQINLSTVYRTLELLCELGVAVEVETQGDDRHRYELVGEDNHHHHLICQNCQAEIELDSAVVAKIIADVRSKYGFWLKLPHFVGYGMCEDCTKAHQLN